MNRLLKQKQLLHTAALLLMILPPAPLYLAAQAGHTGWIWAWLALVILGNMLAAVMR
jgi:hypothetical protein